MKKNLNVIQIKGIKGLIILGMVLCCLAAGFIVFPGWIAMHLWNYIAALCEAVPSIGVVQGVLLWGIIIASYFTFRREKIVICIKSPKGLNEDELKAVFSDIKKQSKDDKIIQSMLKAREAELKIKNMENNSDDVSLSDNKDEVNSNQN